MNPRVLTLLATILIVGPACLAQTHSSKSKLLPVKGPFCDAPKLAEPGTVDKDQPANTVDIAKVVQMVDQALKCYQALSGDADPTQPKGLHKLSSAVMDFKTTTGKTVGFSLSVYVFKVGASREKDVTDELKFTYSVPKNVSLPKTNNLVKPSPTPLFEELVKEIGAASRAAQAQSAALSLPLSKVVVTVSYGIKFDGNVGINVPIQLVTIGGNGDYNKNNTQTIELTFGE